MKATVNFDFKIIPDAEYERHKNTFEKWWELELKRKDAIGTYTYTIVRPFAVQKVLNTIFHLN